MGGEQYGYCTPPRSPRYEGPNEYGDTSTNTRSTSRPAKREASTPAPNATHRSGCTSSRGSSLVRSRSKRDTSGARVEPPTSRMASRSPLRSAAGGRAYFHAREGPGIGGQIQVKGHCAFRRPAPQPPVAAALGEAHAAQADPFAGAQPIVFGGQVRGSLFQPMDIHPRRHPNRYATTVCSALNGSTSTASGCATIL